jgi:hypothetical protein
VEGANPLKKTPKILAEIKELMKYEAAGDPITGLKWSRITPGKIARILKESAGIKICGNTVGKILKEMDFSLKANRKTIPVSSTPDRDQQFSIIRKLRERFQVEGSPIISVDAKKRELVGPFKNLGRAWSRLWRLVYDHDFRSLAKGIAIPYGIYDVPANRGYVFVGTSFDTSEFAVSSIAKWWDYYGCSRYRGVRKLLILADGGGSNGYRCRAWKRWIQEKLCNLYGLAVTVSHYPTGSSKWNPIEHRLFSEISKNWAGRPLDSYEAILNYIETTSTLTGLKVCSYLDQRQYEKGVRVSDDIMQGLAIEADQDLGKWNYTLYPQ